jgi:hypothetical protein
VAGPIAIAQQFFDSRIRGIDDSTFDPARYRPTGKHVALLATSIGRMSAHGSARRALVEVRRFAAVRSACAQVAQEDLGGDRSGRRIG